MNLKHEVNMELIPEHESERLIHAESLLDLSGEKIATVFYEVVKNRLQHVNSWSIIANTLSAKFQLVNKQGIEVYRKAQEGDFLKMELTRSDSSIGTYNDWFRIEALDNFSNEDQTESFGFRVRASPNPHHVRNSTYPLIDNETSTFIVSRIGSSVRASVYQLTSNNNAIRKNQGHIDDQIPRHFRDGPMLRFSYVEWKNLMDGLISRDNH